MLNCLHSIGMQGKHQLHTALCLVLLFVFQDSYAESFSNVVSKWKEKSTYTINESYNLNGETITIPKNCTLRFDGGRLSNGTVVFQNTRLTGDSILIVVPKGTIAGTVNVNRFGLKRDDKSFDNGQVFNKVGQIFPYLYVEPGDYYCSTPIDWSNNIIKNLQVDGNLHYVKKNSKDVFLTLRTTRGIVNINGKITGPNCNIPDSDTKERSIGICFKDCTNSKAFVSSVGFFY